MGRNFSHWSDREVEATGSHLQSIIVLQWSQGSTIGLQCFIKIVLLSLHLPEKQRLVTEFWQLFLLISLKMPNSICVLPITNFEHYLVKWIYLFYRNNWRTWPPQKKRSNRLCLFRSWFSFHSGHRHTKSDMLPVKRPWILSKVAFRASRLKQAVSFTFCSTYLWKKKKGLWQLVEKPE